MSKDNGKGRQTGKAPAATGSDKPGERVPPAAVRASTLKAAPEAEKKRGSAASRARWETTISPEHRAERPKKWPAGVAGLSDAGNVFRRGRQSGRRRSR